MHRSPIQIQRNTRRNIPGIDGGTRRSRHGDCPAPGQGLSQRGDKAATFRGRYFGVGLTGPSHQRSPDRKSQIRALDRTVPVLPMQPGLIERRSHDYYRHGTSNLFAALDIATGQ
jgi:hypothetical protein